MENQMCLWHFPEYHMYMSIQACGQWLTGAWVRKLSFFVSIRWTLRRNLDSRAPLLTLSLICIFLHSPASPLSYQFSWEGSSLITYTRIPIAGSAFGQLDLGQLPKLFRIYPSIHPSIFIYICYLALSLTSIYVLPPLIPF